MRVSTMFFTSIFLGVVMAAVVPEIAGRDTSLADSKDGRSKNEGHNGHNSGANPHLNLARPNRPSKKAVSSTMTVTIHPRDSPTDDPAYHLATPTPIHKAQSHPDYSSLDGPLPTGTYPLNSEPPTALLRRDVSTTPPCGLQATKPVQDANCSGWGALDTDDVVTIFPENSTPRTLVPGPMITGTHPLNSEQPAALLRREDSTAHFGDLAMPIQTINSGTWDGSRTAASAIHTAAAV